MIKLTTVLLAADNTASLVDLLMLLSNSEDKQIRALLEPYNELVWKQDDAPCCAILVRHELEDGTFNYCIGMTFKGVDYMIHDHDLSQKRSVDKLKTWFPHINPKHYYYQSIKPIGESADSDSPFGTEYLTDLFKVDK
jgi:hypothetical protein